MVVKHRAAAAGGARHDARARRAAARRSTRARSIYYMVKVLLAIFVGLFRRNVVPLEDELSDARSRSRSPARSRRSLLLLVVFELIRSRRLRERYALLWLLTGLVLLVLSALARRAEHDRRLGRRQRLSAGGALRGRARCSSSLVLLHYSTVISRLADQNTILAQRLALLEERFREERDQHRSA